MKRDQRERAEKLSESSYDNPVSDAEELSEVEDKWHDVDSSENENWSVSVPKFTKGKESDLLHYAGQFIYHFQDQNYYKKKPYYIKKFDNKKLFKTVFREDQDSKTLQFNPTYTFKINSNEVFSELLLYQRILHKSLKMELKNIAANQVDNPYFFASSFRFKNFSTHLENHKLSKATGKSEFYRQDIIPNLGSYDSDNETSKTLKKSWQEVNFKEINEQIKIFFKTGELNPDNIEKINEIISLLFIAETNRNPATYLTAPMFLELLAANKINLRSNDDNSNIKAFPMQMKGAVSGARSLYKLELGELKFTYDYLKGSAQESKILGDKENGLFKKWLKFKKIKSKTKEWNTEIQKFILDWYGIVIQLKAAGDKKENFEEESGENILSYKNDQDFQKQDHSKKPDRKYDHSTDCMKQILYQSPPTYFNASGTTQENTRISNDKFIQKFQDWTINDKTAYYESFNSSYNDVIMKEQKQDCKVICYLDKLSSSKLFAWLTVGCTTRTQKLLNLNYSEHCIKKIFRVLEDPALPNLFAKYSAITHDHEVQKEMLLSGEAIVNLEEH